MRFIRKLSEQQEEELRARHRHGATARERTRALAVLMSSRGQPIGELAVLLDVRREAVSHWLDRWEEGGAEALADAPRAGRPPKVGACEESAVVAAAQAAPASPRRELAKKGGFRSAGTR